MGQHADDALNYFTKKEFGVEVVDTGEKRKRKPKDADRRDRCQITR